MNIEKAVEKMRKSIETLDEKPYKSIFDKYRKKLLKEIDKNPNNVEVYCTLPIIFTELNYPDKKSIKILNKCYKINGAEFTDKEYAMWATNKAYIIDTGCFDDKEQVIDILSEAERRNSSFWETYFGLGVYYYNKKMYDEALKGFSKAWELSNIRKALYNAAICLLHIGKIKEAVLFLEDLYNMTWSNKYDKSQMAFTLVRELLILGEKEKAISIFNSIDEKEEFFSWEASEICYMINDYSGFVHFYECEDWYEEEDFFSMYIYSLIHSGNEEKAHEKMRYTREKILSNIEYIKYLPVEDFESSKDKKERILEEKNRLNSIEKAYKKIIETDFRPQPEAYYGIMERCYFINCPRHKGEF